MIHFFRYTHLGPRLLPALGVIAFLFALSFNWGFLFPIAQGLTVLILALLLAEGLILYGGQIRLDAHRDVPQLLSLGDENPVRIHIQNHSAISVEIELVDELPVQLQERRFSKSIRIEENATETLAYHIRPTSRGVYAYGDLQLLVSGPIGLFRRRFTIPASMDCKVYPSIIQMKEFELKAFSRIATSEGVKKLRKMGVSYEFEQINPYVKGDDIRHINWKATARRQELMVNRFETERSQSVYNVICKNREMRMPFHGMSLMDHAVNTTLAVSNIALHKYDKIGLITFSDKIGSMLRASRERKQLKHLMNALYKERERETEANYDLLNLSIRQLAPNRSLIFLYINFESPYALDRALPYLKSISKRHLLVVIFFKNVEVEAYTSSPAKDLRGIYKRTIAQKMVNEKEAMLRKLRQAKIQTILTEPDRLSMRTVDKYLELKGRGLI
ncbi:MAG: DUF58 domain-containing protein [Flavobacteriales bacterium]|nr:DUF58 domain-containing protein [Flavobacteriales bacterium]